MGSGKPQGDHEIGVYTYAAGAEQVAPGDFPALQDALESHTLAFGQLDYSDADYWPTIIANRYGIWAMNQYGGVAVMMKQTLRHGHEVYVIAAMHVDDQRADWNRPYGGMTIGGDLCRTWERAMENFIVVAEEGYSG